MAFSLASIGSSLPSGSEPTDDDKKPRKGFRSAADIFNTYWHYPDGPKIPAILICMNFYTDKHYTYVPSEIGMGAFTIQDGFDNREDQGCYWTLVDPIKAPQGFGVDAYNNAKRDYLPVPDFPPSGKRFRDYVRITDEIDDFIAKRRYDKAGQTFLFCPRSTLQACQSCLIWLYDKAGKQFSHDILQWEQFLVVLSCNGLVHQEHASNFKLDLRQMVEKIRETINKCDDFRSSCSPESMSSRISTAVQSFTSTTTVDESRYSYLKKGVTRTATTYQDKHPSAMMGAFLYEDHAEAYMSITDFADDMEHYACPYHREEIIFEGLDGIKRKLKGDDEDRPKNGIVRCALINALRQVYLAFDVLLVHFPVNPKKGKHWPAASSTTTTSSKSKK